MRITPRARLLALCALFGLPIVASLLAYRYFPPQPTANYGELLPPMRILTRELGREGGGTFRFPDLQGKWVLLAADSGACPPECVEKLVTLRQVRLALGRNAGRVERVFVIDDGRRPRAGLLEPFAGMLVALAPDTGVPLPAPANDRAHIYLVDPNGNVMMRFPAAPDRKRVLRDLERLLRASQIG